MYKILKPVLGCTFIVMLMIMSTAKASQVNDFIGVYNAFNWTVTQSGDSNGTVDGSGLTESLSIIEPDESLGGLGDDHSEITLLTTAAGDGIFRFDWSFDTNPDDCCSGVNVYNGVGELLLDLGTADFDDAVDGVFSGSYSMSVLAGDIIGWGVFSTDSCCGSNILTISDFTAPAPSAIPVPAAVWLFGTALIGLVGFGKRRKAA